MKDSRDAAGAYVVGRNTLSAMCVVGMLTMLGACAAESAGGAATSAPATAPSPAASPVAASTTTPAAPKAPHALTPTEINEQCWMSNEVNKMKDLDAKARYVDKCVAERMKAEGM